MFCDIRNFTQFSNTHDPELVRAEINEFFDRAAQCINAESGVINKFLGGGFLAVFGLFDKNEDPRITSTRAALDILTSTREALEARNLGVGIALNYGEVIAGEIGSEGRCEFTVLGNTMNIAARLEGLNRVLKTNFLATRSFYESLPAGLVIAKSHGDHDIRGITGSTEVVELQPTDG
jgi:adenylate cyclase